MKKRSVLYTWGVELALMLVLVIVMCVALTGAARSRLLNEYEQIAALQQEKIETSLDGYFTQLRGQAVELVNDGTIMSFASLSTPATADNYSLYQIQNRLVSAVSAGITEHIFIYFQNIQRAISDETILEPADCARKLLGGADAEHLQQFVSLTGQTALSRLVVVGSGENTVVLTLTSVPSVGRWPRAVILQQVSPERLRKILESHSSLEQATTLLLNEEHSMVCHTGDSTLAAQLAVRYDECGASDRFEADGRKYWIYQKKLDSTGWSLITAAPMEIIQSRSDWVWKLTLVFMMALIFVWIVASATILHWNYRPLQKLKSRADFAPDSPGNESPGNEYEQIDLAFQTVRNDLETLKRMQQNQREVLLREWLGNAIAYDIPLYQPVADDMLSSMELQLEHGFFLLVLPRNGEPLETADFLPEAEDCQLVITSPRGRPVICLLAADTAALQAFARAVENSLQQNGIEYLCGRMQQGVSDLHSEFVALCERAEYSAPAATGSIRLSLASSEEIPQLVFTGKGQDACRLLSRSVEVNLDGQPMLMPLAWMYYNDFLLHLLNEVPEGAVCTEVQRAIVATARALQNAVHQADMQELVETLLLAIAAKYQPQPGDTPPDLLEQCIVCVREHFREHDFNVSRMADMLGVGVPYLSKYFKEHAGVNLLGYLNSVRIDYAKRLIAEEKLTVAAAADRAGFENINTFIRLFKKYVGDTPGAYSKR